ncbi:MAG: HpcH/HpaI aldolase family protein [Pleomorphochaeta sp.]
MTLKEKMKNGPVFGVVCYTGAVCAVEAIGYSGFDFVYLDLEHCPIDNVSNIEKLILAAKTSGVSPLVRVSCVDEVEIRKVLEMGAEGVIVPHCRTKADIEAIIHSAKFPPIGRRGGESCVRAAQFGVNDFSWDEYTKKSNEDTLVIPMDEDFEFSDNIEEIFSVDGIDAINFGPIDYSLSIGAKVGYKNDDNRLKEAYNKLADETKKRNIGILAPVVPSSPADLKQAIDKGINMLILGNDMLYFNKALAQLKENIKEIK